MSHEQPYQVMPQMDDQAFERLKEDIKQHGVEYPIIINADDEVIDGHHRKRAWQELGRDVDDLPTRIVDASDSENYHRAYRTNLLQRDLTDGTKRQVVKQYLLEHPERVDDDTQEAIASDLGVSQMSVSNAISELKDSGKLKKVFELPTDEKKQRVRDYVDENPDSSNRDVADAVDFDITYRTVGNWRNEWGEDTDDATGLDAFTTSAKEKEATMDVASKAKSDDEEIAETAKQEAEKVDKGKSPTSAAKEIEKTEAEQEVQDQKDVDTDQENNAVVEQCEATELLNKTTDADALITDPPYTTDVDDIESFVSEWLPKAIDTIGDSGVGFITVGAYTDELDAYLGVLDECGVRDRTQVMVWTYKNTLGQTPNDEYKRNWQAILFIQSDPTTEIDAPKTSEQWGVQEINAPDGRHDGRHHKWEKPTELFERFIRHTTEVGDTVVDPFVGTGTTALVCDDLGREVAAGDIDNDMLEIAEERGCVINE